MMNKIKNKIKKIKKNIGNTPIIKLENKKNNNNIYAKIETTNFSGSIKDRPVNSILLNGVLNNEIDKNTVIIKSSSGNFAISCALHCLKLRIKFIPIIDPLINRLNHDLLKQLCEEVIMIDEIDETGGYLLNRIKKVKELLAENKNYYWTNQYNNPNNYLAYKELSNEINLHKVDFDFIFIAVSSTGTLKGVSTFNTNKKTKIIGVDVVGSQIFSNIKQKRHISGIGASYKSNFLNDSDYSDIVILNNLEIIDGCNELLKQQQLLLGGSSGACYSAALKYIEVNKINKKNILIICPDSGISYMDTIYNKDWTNKIENEIY